MQQSQFMALPLEHQLSDTPTRRHQEGWDESQTSGGALNTESGALQKESRQETDPRPLYYLWHLKIATEENLLLA